MMKYQGARVARAPLPRRRRASNGGGLRFIYVGILRLARGMKPWPSSREGEPAAPRLNALRESRRRARKPRADALRNRDRLLEAAKASFADAGADVSLDEIARRAGVGIGTLYRHFPS